MLDDRDEGLYAWYTFNLLLGKLHDISNSIAILDLGGGSTQITFAINNTQTLVSLEFELLLKVIFR
jgi:Golgi nucleoside diphosphatase